jgi:spermidine/putrescine transport system substrate-binding protein
LVLLNWADYLDPELVAEFEEKHKAKVREVYFESDDARDGMLAEAGGRGYDLVLINEVQVGVYRKQGWLAPITPENVPNLRHIDSRWVTAYEATAGFAVPYFWGTLGIAYRADLVPEGIVSWKQLFQPSEALRGKIQMIRSSREVIGMALKALGYSANSTDPKQLAEAEQLLLNQKPFVRDYTIVDLDEESSLVKGTTVAALLYSGDTLMVQEHHPEIVYVVPKEGGSLWVDYLAVMEHSQNKALALKFIDFLNEPENAARLADYVHYGTPNQAAEKHLSDEYLQDPIIYPDARVLETSEFLSELSPRVLRKYNRIFQKVLR